MDSIFVRPIRKSRTGKTVPKFLNLIVREYILYNQTKSNGHMPLMTTISGPIFNVHDLRITTTCQQRPLFFGPESGRCIQV